MEFINNPSSLRKPSQVDFNLPDTKIPTDTDVYFRAKQDELVDQYSAARIFMYETETDDWKHWIGSPKDQSASNEFRLLLKSHFYETALFYYNAVVDISWVLCYVAVEFACSNKGVRVDISGIKPIEEAAELLRNAECNVTSPTAEDNPFSYLKLMCPEFEPVINHIVNFWNSFSSSEIRKRYNYCKHKGRPLYKELEPYNFRFMNIFIDNKGNGNYKHVASSPQDVRYSFSLEDAISELRDFDDNMLFPYIQKLISSIENILQPSPMVF